MDRKKLDDGLPAVVSEMVRSVEREPGIQHLNQVMLPSRDAIIEAVELLRQLMYPGYYGKQSLTSQNVQFRVGELVSELSDLLFVQVRCCLRYRQQIPEKNCGQTNSAECDAEAADVVAKFFARLPAVRHLLAKDVQATFDGDPAAESTDETVFCYPGVFAITVQRLAHEFYKLNVPLMPRIMTEYAHSLTGIDIHPGAKLGERFFIDHGTGIVIGETTEIGNNVKIYHGVTLGALAPAHGQAMRGQKRHPAIRNDVTIYPGATILGGDTVIGEGSTIGGNVFLTASVPPRNRVTVEPPKLKYRDRRKAGDLPLDFQI